MAWLDAMFGVLYDNGEELEILGGLNFVGFTITEDAANNRHNIAVAGAATTSDSVSNESAVSGASVTDALNTLDGLVDTNTAAIATAVLGTRSLTAGAGLTGGGDLSADRTFTVVAADGTITVNADSIQVGTVGNANLADNTVALARLVNATAQYDFVMRTSSGAGAWERGTRASLVLAIDAQHVATSFGSPFVKLGASGGTYGTSGLLRAAFTSNVGGGVTILTGVTDDGLTTMNLLRYGVSGQYIATWGDGASANGIKEHNFRMLAGGGGFTVTIGGAAEWNFDASQCNANGNNFVSVGTIGCGAVTSTGLGTFVGIAAGGAVTGVTTLNGASVAAPVQGTAITTTTTINISSGSEYDVSSAGGAYAITLGTSGSPADGDTVILRASNALANAVTVTNGGTGGGNLGPSGVMTAALKATYTYYYDGTATAWKYGGRTRCA